MKTLHSLKKQKFVRQPVYSIPAHSVLTIVGQNGEPDRVILRNFAVEFNMPFRGFTTNAV
jgi:hypothetical protein